MYKYILEQAGNINWMAVFALSTFVFVFLNSILLILRKDKAPILKYDRTFHPDETKEIRLYGLRGKDKSIIKGTNDAKIKIRIIGGEDDDLIKNETSGRKIFAYDEPDGIKNHHG